MHNVYTYSAVKCFIRKRRGTSLFSPFYCEMNCTAFNSLHMEICYLCALLKMIPHYVCFMCACGYISDTLHCHLGHSLRTPCYSESSSIIIGSSTSKELFIAMYFLETFLVYHYSTHYWNSCFCGKMMLFHSTVAQLSQAVAKGLN